MSVAGVRSPEFVVHTPLQSAAPFKKPAQQGSAFGLAQSWINDEAVVQSRIVEDIVDRTCSADSWIARAVYEAGDPGMDHRARAHDAGFDRAVQRRSGQAIVAII